MSETRDLDHWLQLKELLKERRRKAKLELDVIDHEIELVERELKRPVKPVWPAGLMILGALMLGGCCSTYYRDERIEVSRLAFGVDSQATRIQVTTTGTTTTVKVGELDGNGTEGLKAAAEGAVKGLK